MINLSKWEHLKLFIVILHCGELFINFENSNYNFQQKKGRILSNLMLRARLPLPACPFLECLGGCACCGAVLLLPSGRGRAAGQRPAVARGPSGLRPSEAAPRRACPRRRPPCRAPPRRVWGIGSRRAGRQGRLGASGEAPLQSLQSATVPAYGPWRPSGPRVDHHWGRADRGRGQASCLGRWCGGGWVSQSHDRSAYIWREV